MPEAQLPPPATPSICCGLKCSSVTTYRYRPYPVTVRIRFQGKIFILGRCPGKGPDL